MMEKEKKGGSKSASLVRRLTGRILLADLMFLGITVIVSVVLGGRYATDQINQAQYGALMAILVVVMCALAAVMAVQFARKLARPISNASAQLEHLGEGYVDGGDAKPMRTGIQELDLLHIAITETISYLNKYITNIDTTLDRISHSDLAFEITEDYMGDFAKIKESMNKIVDSLNHTIGGIGSVSGEVLNISERIFLQFTGFGTGGHRAGQRGGGTPFYCEWYFLPRGRDGLPCGKGK